MWRSLVVIGLLLVAGCGGLIGPGQVGTSTPTLTPAPPLSADPPPGVSATGVTNVTVLAAAHGAALGDRSFTHRSRFRVVDEEGTVYGENITMRVAADGRVVSTRRVEWSNRASVPSLATRTDLYYANGTTFTRGTDSGVSYDHVQAPMEPDGLREVQRLRELYIAGRHWTVTETHVEGARGYTLVTTDVALTALRPSSFVRSPRDVRLRVTVTAAGQLVDWRLTYVVDFAGGPAQATRTARLSAVGETSVVQPEWLSEAKNATK